jgi:hypothetical protein
MGTGPETPDTIILETGVGLLALGLVLITGGVVGALLARRQYGAVFPLSLMLAAVALLLWWEPLVRVVASFALLLIGYTWLFAWWRASQQGRGQVPFHQSHFAREGRRSSHTMVEARADGVGCDHCASATRTVLEVRQTDGNARLAGAHPGTRALSFRQSVSSVESQEVQDEWVPRK